MRVIHREDAGQGVTGKLENCCHWPRCEKPLPPRMYFCTAHWKRLPKEIRNQFIASPIRAMKEAQRWIGLYCDV